MYLYFHLLLMHVPTQVSLSCSFSVNQQLGLSIASIYVNKTP